MEFSNEHWNDRDGHQQPRWSKLGFQDLDDDEAFLVWAYRYWQQENEPASPAGHLSSLTDLLRQDPLSTLLPSLLSLFRIFGRDAAMNESLQGFPMLTSREERLLGILGEPPQTVSTPCGEQAARCRVGLAQQGIRLRHPRHIPRCGRDLPELRIARSYGAPWRRPKYSDDSMESGWTVDTPA